MSDNAWCRDVPDPVGQADWARTLCRSAGRAQAATIDILRIIQESPDQFGLRIWTQETGLFDDREITADIGATWVAFETNRPLQLAGPVEQWEAEVPATAGADRTV